MSSASQKEIFLKGIEKINEWPFYSITIDEYVANKGIKETFTTVGSVKYIP